MTRRTPDAGTVATATVGLIDPQRPSVGSVRAHRGRKQAQDGSESLNVAQRASQSRSGAKYGNRVTYVDGVAFASKKEAERFGYLRMLEQASVIRDLEAHPRFQLVVHEQDCGYYEADFAYIDADGQRIVEDVKSAATRKLPTYRLKVRLLWALYGLRVMEV